MGLFGLFLHLFSFINEYFFCIPWECSKYIARPVLCPWVASFHCPTGHICNLLDLTEYEWILVWMNWREGDTETCHTSAGESVLLSCWEKGPHWHPDQSSHLGTAWSRGAKARTKLGALDGPPITAAPSLSSQDAQTLRRTDYQLKGAGNKTEWREKCTRSSP